MAFVSPATTTLIPSGTAFAALSGLSGLASAIIAANTDGTNAPTSAPTLAASSSTGATLPAASYFVKITETNGMGETTASPPSSAQTVTLGQKLTVTFPALKTGNTARNVYVATASGGPYRMVARGITTATFDITAPLPSDSSAVVPPTANTTGINNTDMRRAVQTAAENPGVVWARLQSIDRNFRRGDPIPFNEFMQAVRNAQTGFAVLVQACNELGALIDSHPGSITTTNTGIGGVKTVRTWP